MVLNIWLGAAIFLIALGRVLSTQHVSSQRLLSSHVLAVTARVGRGAINLWCGRMVHLSGKMSLVSPSGAQQFSMSLGQKSQ